MESKIKSNNIVTLIFSKDRPLQLDLTLNTYKRFSIDREFEDIIVLYTTTNNEFEKAYDCLKKEHSDIKFLKETNFKENVINILSHKEYVLFVVDDCIFTDRFSTKKIISVIENYNTIGFSLRLGENTTYCYPLYRNNDIPNFDSINESMLLFNCKPNKIGDYYYPLEVSSSIFLTKDILKILYNHSFRNPNLLEEVLHNNRHQLDYKQNLSCYRKSVAFCNPVNLVQTVSNLARRSSDESYSSKNLLNKYLSGKRIDERPFWNFVSTGCHQEVNFNFIEKGNQ